MTARPAGATAANHGVRGSDTAQTLRAMLLGGRWPQPRGVRAGALVDPDSGLLIDAFSDGPEPVDLELLGAVAADVVRSATLMDHAVGGSHVLRPSRLHFEAESSRHVIVSTSADLRGDGVVLAIVVEGDQRTARRVAHRLAAITAVTLQNAQSELDHGVPGVPDAVRTAGRHRIGGDLPAVIPGPRPRPYVAPTSSFPVPGGPADGPTPYRRS